MIDLKNVPPDFTGTWFQDSLQGDFNIYILEIKENFFFGIKTDTQGPAAINGIFFKDKTIFLKNYSDWTKMTTLASTDSLFYQFNENIFNLKEDTEISGIWTFSTFPDGGRVSLKIKKKFNLPTTLVIGPIQQKIYDEALELISLKEQASSGKDSAVDDLPF